VALTAVSVSAMCRVPKATPGAHAHAEFGIPVIGVAKSRFRTATHAVPVLRGSSVRPLFVTSSGMPAADAAALVRRMAGRYRRPDALRRAGTLARTGPPAPAMNDRQPGWPAQTRGTRSCEDVFSCAAMTRISAS
jgi:hypothetical protein